MKKKNEDIKEKIKKELEIELNKDINNKDIIIDNIGKNIIDENNTKNK